MRSSQAHKIFYFCRMIHFLALFSRQGKVRLQKWFVSYTEKEKKGILREVMALVLARKPKMSSFLEWKDMKLVYRRYITFVLLWIPLRYASLYFLCAIEPDDNELLTLEVIHRYVEILDKYFGNVRFYYWAPKNLGLWIRHNFPFWKSLLRSRRILVCWRGTRNWLQNHNGGYRCTGHTPGGCHFSHF